MLAIETSVRRSASKTIRWISLLTCQPEVFKKQNFISEIYLDSKTSQTDRIIYSNFMRILKFQNLWPTKTWCLIGNGATENIEKTTTKKTVGWEMCDHKLRDRRRVWSAKWLNIETLLIIFLRWIELGILFDHYFIIYAPSSQIVRMRLLLTL